MSDYPSEDDLKRIKNWTIASGEDCRMLLDYVRAQWWQADWGWTEKHDDKRRYEISTGGWSGNEDLVGALMDNPMFVALAWESSRRGGHHEFAFAVPSPEPPREEPRE